MIRVFCSLALAVSLTACSVQQVAKVDPNTGHFPSSKSAPVTTNKTVDLDSKKTLVLIPDNDFVRGQIKNIGYFDDIMTIDELEKKIIQENLSSKVPSVRDRIGLHNAAINYKNFLWFHVDSTGTGNSRRSQFILTDAATMEDYFVTETKLDYVWSGVNDQNNWYPMFNSLIDYIKTNSHTYKK